MTVLRLAEGLVLRTCLEQRAANRQGTERTLNCCEGILEDKQTLCCQTSALLSFKSYLWTRPWPHLLGTGYDGLDDPPQSESKCKSRSVTGLEWPRGFQEVKFPRFHNGTGRW